MAGSNEQIAARARAALAYADITVKDADAQIGISRATMTRIVSPSRPRGASIDELRQIADACKVPRWFMEQGFAGRQEDGDRIAGLEERLARLEASQPEPLSPDQQRAAFDLLARQLLAAGRAIRQGQEPEHSDTGAPDRSRRSAGGAA